MTYQATVNGGLAMGPVIPNTARYLHIQTTRTEPARTYGPTDSNTSDVTVRAPVLSLQKTVTANPNPDWCEETTFQVTVTNNGDADRPECRCCGHHTVAALQLRGRKHRRRLARGRIDRRPGGRAGARPYLGPQRRADPAESLVLTFNMLTEQWAAHGLHTNTATASAEDGAGSPVPEAANTADIDVKQVYGVT